jgi:O-acetyl-ADP-ribose deacetylase (regulator of RNase III)
MVAAYTWRGSAMPNELLVHVSLPHGREFDVVLGNLLDEPVDAIVNAANGHLAHGGGVAAAIASAAGPALEADGDRIVEQHGVIEVGDAVVTVAGRLPFKGVIHAVGPHMGVGDEEAKLVRALKSAFTRADERRWTSVSFPAVSSGIFAVPLPICARAYVSAVREFCDERPETSLRVLRLCLVRGPLIAEVRRALGE